MTTEELARKMHETYERLAPQFGWETQKRSQKPWEEVPEENKKLMVAVISEVFTEEAIKAHMPAVMNSVGAKRAEAETLSNLAQELRGFLTVPGTNPGQRLFDMLSRWEKRAGELLRV